MSKFYIPTMGALGPLRSLGQMLREQHERLSADQIARIDALTEAGVSVEQDVDVLEVRELIAEIDTGPDATLATLRDGIEAAYAYAGKRPAPLPDYDGDPALSGVLVRLRAISASNYAQHMDAVNTAIKARDSRALAIAQGDFVAWTVAEVRGLVTDNDEDVSVTVDGETGHLPDEGVDLLSAGGLLVSLFVAARCFQELPPLVRRSCGVSQPQT